MLRHPYENKNETVNKSCAVKVADAAICADEEKKVSGQARHTRQAFTATSG